VPELQRLEARDGALHIGAAVSLERAWAALVAQWPALESLWLRFASPPVRHAGTLGGNIANGSPIGDGAPALIALGATLTLRRGGRTRSLPLEDFYVDYMVNRLEPGEFVQAMHVPLPVEGQVLRAYKVSKRHDSDISAVCAVFALRLDGGVVREARLVYGGMAATVRRAAAAEAVLHGQAWDAAAVEAAMQALTQDFTPLDDLRASAGYRRQVAANLLRRAWLETRAVDPLPATATQVWPLRAEPAGATP
jgi:xanthine dehydrogenase small subunit